MSTAIIKKKIMDKLSKSNDEQLLYTIYDLLKDESKQSLLVLGNAQIMAIKIAEEEVAEGKVLTDIEVRKRTGGKGILIFPVKAKTSFQKKMELARENKMAIYKQMKKEADDPKASAFYNDPNTTLV